MATANMTHQATPNSSRAGQGHSGTDSPVTNTYMNGDYYDFQSSGSSTRGRFEMSGIGQVSMTDVTLEQALERVQELKTENNELREHLKENSDMMKLQIQNLAEWKEKIRQSNIQNKEKYDQTKQVVLQLKGQNEQLKQKLVEAEKKANSQQDTMIVEKDEEYEKMIKENELLNTNIKELERNMQESQSVKEQLLRDLENYAELKETLQKENAQLEEDNSEITSKLQTLLSDSKSVKNENKELRSKIHDLEEQMKAVTIGNGAVTSPSRDESTTNQGCSDGRGKVHERNQRAGVDAQIAQKLKDYESMVTKLTQEIHQKNEELQEYQRSDQSSQTLKSQVVSLISEVTESQGKLKASTECLEKKTSRVSELEHTVQRLQEEMQSKRMEDAAQIESLRISVKSYEDDLNAERIELMNTRKQIGDIRMSFNKVVSENKELRDRLEANLPQPMQDAEKQKLLGEIGRMTAQVLAAEEAISYRDEQLKQLQKENGALKEENENTIPVLRAQAEVWKSDFDAERSAREKQHMEKERMKEEIKQLQIRNQQLVDEMESSSKRQFSEMQQRHVPNTYQHAMQQRLGVASPPVGYPAYNQPGAHNQVQPQGVQGYPHVNQQQGQGYSQYPPQVQGYPNPYQAYPDQSRTSPKGMENRTNQQQGYRNVPNSQNEEDLQLECPKCRLMCPDMDTLQIHVLECIEEGTV